MNQMQFGGGMLAKTNYYKRKEPLWTSNVPESDMYTPFSTETADVRLRVVT